MAKNPSTRWFFNDWMGDLGLRRCSLAARGLWADMLALCANAKRYGYLETDDGKRLSIAELARQVGAARGTVDRLLHELEGNNVFSRDDDGVIFNRRMVRETTEAATRKTKGGTPKKTDRERDPNQLDFFEDRENPRTRACDSRLLASRIPDSDLETPESLPAAPAIENIDEANPLSALRAPWVPCRDSSAVERRAEDPCDGGSIPSLDAITPIGVAAKSDVDVSASFVSSASSPSIRFGALRGDAGFTPIGDHCPPRAPLGRSRQRVEKSPALKAKIRQQLMAKHCRFLQAHGREDEIGAYWAAQLSDDPDAAQRMLDDVDRRMRSAAWDDMREWKRQAGIAG
jgi:hypothetical protein